MATRIAENVSIDPRAEIDDDVEIGPFCIIGPKARIGRGSKLEGNVTLMGDVTIGQRNHIYPGVVIGGEPQDLSYRGSNTRVVIGDDNVIRECVTINRASGEGRRGDPAGQSQLPHGLLPHGPRLPVGRSHRDRQRHAPGRTRPHPRPRLAFRRAWAYTISPRSAAMPSWPA